MMTLESMLSEKSLILLMKTKVVLMKPVFLFFVFSSSFLDGALSFEEWQAASKALYDAIRGEAEEKVVGENYLFCFVFV